MFPLGCGLKALCLILLVEFVTNLSIARYIFNMTISAQNEENKVTTDPEVLNHYAKSISTLDSAGYLVIAVTTAYTIAFLMMVNVFRQGEPRKWVAWGCYVVMFAEFLKIPVFPIVNGALGISSPYNKIGSLWVLIPGYIMHCLFWFYYSTAAKRYAQTK